MDRHSFLAAQLWLRKVSATESPWPRSDQQPADGVKQLLPPRSLASQSPSQEPVQCSACFHVGSSICYFLASQENEDQTLLRAEIVSSERSGGGSALFVRFDGRDVFEIALSAIKSVVRPNDSTSARATNLPPFGEIDFGSVSLRLWLDSEFTPAPEAHRVLTEGLRRIEMLRSQHWIQLLKVKRQPNGLRDLYRHNHWLNRRSSKSVEGLIVPSRLLAVAEDVLTSNADKEAVRMALNKVQVQEQRLTDLNSNQSSSSSDGTASSISIEPAQRQPDSGSESESRHDQLNEADSTSVVVELARTFGEDTRSLYRLLGISAGCLSNRHDNCRSLSTGCVVQKWSRWEEFLQSAQQAVDLPNKRRRTSSGASADMRTQASAVASFRESILDTDELRAMQNAHKAASKRLRDLEDVVFRALFPRPSPGRMACSRSATPQASRLDRDSATCGASQRDEAAADVERLWDLLVESRRALVQQELARTCLPWRAHDMATDSV